MTLTVTNFILKVAHYLKLVSQGEEILLTFHDKPYVKLISLVKSDTKVISLDKEKKGKVISLLNKTTQKIINKPQKLEVSEEIHYCLACSKLGRRREAVDLVDVYEDGQERKIWLCGVCKSKYSVCV